MSAANPVTLYGTLGPRCRWALAEAARFLLFAAGSSLIGWTAFLEIPWCWQPFTAAFAACAFTALAFSAQASYPRREELRRPLAGAELLDAWVYGDSIPALTEAALAKARGLYGEDAELEVVRVNHISTTEFRDKGRYCTHVYVRCLGMPAGALRTPEEVTP